MDDFNKRCAEALGWILIENIWHIKSDKALRPYVVSPDGLHPYAVAPDGKVRIMHLHFHDSYDWAMLLVKECAKGLQKRIAFRRIFSDWNLDWYHATPHQIAQAALSVLEGEKE